MCYNKRIDGSVSEWLKEHAWNACNVERHSEVRILSLPPKQVLASATRPEGRTLPPNIKMRPEGLYFYIWCILSLLDKGITPGFREISETKKVRNGRCNVCKASIVHWDNFVFIFIFSVVVEDAWNWVG